MPRQKIHEDRTAYQNQWKKANKDRIELTLDKDAEVNKSKVGEAAAKVGQSLNVYILQAIEERMERDRVGQAPAKVESRARVAE